MPEVEPVMAAARSLRNIGVKAPDNRFENA
jgi:hypothetical protein